jgi:hypothetical protein
MSKKPAVRRPWLWLILSVPFALGQGLPPEPPPVNPPKK